MLAVSMPNVATSPAFVETATKCFATALTSPPKPSSNHARALCALVIVSSVVKVFEETMTSVSAGSRSRTASIKSAPRSEERRVGKEGRSRCLPYLDKKKRRRWELERSLDVRLSQLAVSVAMHG